MKLKRLLSMALIIMLMLSTGHPDKMYALKQKSKVSDSVIRNNSVSLVSSVSSRNEESDILVGSQEEGGSSNDNNVSDVQGGQETNSPNEGVEESNPNEDSPSIPSETNLPDGGLNLESLAASDDLAVVMTSGESYVFVNNGAKSVIISTDATSSKSNTYDNVTFRVDGSILNAQMDSTGSFSVISGGSAIVTATGSNSITLKLKPEISYYVSADPALNRVLLTQWESYRFINESASSETLLSDSNSNKGKIYDYAVYKESGELSSSYFSSSGKPSIPAGGEIIITGVGSSPVIVATPNRFFRGETSAEPAYTRVTIHQGESYRFSNISGKSDALQSDGTSKDKFDYAIYLPDGTESSRGTNTATKPNVPGGRYCILTQITENPVTYGVPYRTFDVRPSNGDAISRITVYPSDSVIFRNNGSLYNPIANDANSQEAGRFDYVIYDSEGKLYSNGFNSKSKPNIKSKGYGVFTVSGSVPITFDYTDDFSVEYTPEPAFHRITLNKGESVTFFNHSNATVFLDSDAYVSQNRFFDYVTYFPDGTEKSRGKGTAVEPGVPAGYRTVVTGAGDAPVTVGAIYSVFDVEGRSGDAISHVTVNPGQSVIFHNGGSLANPIINNASKINGVFDYVMYKANGSVYWDSFNQSNNAPNVPAGGEGVVTVAGDQPIVFDYTDEFTIEDSANPAYLRVTLNRGESYSFTNISPVQEGLDSNASTLQKRLFDAVIYSADGSERSRHESTATNPILKSGEKAVVTTASDNPVTFGAIYRSFRGQGDEGGHMLRTTITPGQSYSFFNSSDQTLNLEKVGNATDIIDYAVYDSNGKLWSDGFGASASIRVPAGGDAIITNISEVNFIVEYSEAVSSIPSSEPAFHRITLAKGLSYQFKNISNQSKSLEEDASPTNDKRFDYIVYRNDNSERARESSTHTAPGVNAGERAVVTTVSESPIIFGAVYRLFEVTPIDTPTVTKVTIGQGQSYLFTNMSTADAVMQNNAIKQNGTFDFAIYGGANQSISAGMDGNASSLTIPSTGSAVITVTSSESVTFEFPKTINAQSSADPALLKKSLIAGESAAFHNKSYYEATILTNSSSGQHNFYDFRVLDTNHNVLSKGEHVFGPQQVPSSADIQFFNTSAEGVVFAGAYRNFTLEDIGVEFIDLIDTVEQTIPETQSKTVYYRFKPSFTGTYRFAVKETGDAEQQPRIVLFDDKEIKHPLISSVETEQIYGTEYTTMEIDLEGGRYYYLKLDEKDSKGLVGSIKAAKMNKQSSSVYEYGQANELIKITLITGDQILFEYDKNGNVSRRMKNIFPYFK